MGQGSSGLFYGTKGNNLPQLPNIENATIPIEKLTKYSLKPGTDKAIAFKLALGFDISSAEQLKDQIIANLPNITAKIREKTTYGQNFQVDLKLVGLNGKTANVRTAWIIREENGNPQLTSAYVH
jgi:hypothetical protein